MDAGNELGLLTQIHIAMRAWPPSLVTEKLVMSHDQIKLLQQMPVFGGLLPKTLQMILDQSELVHVRASDYFCHEGERGECLFVLETGAVVIEKNWQANPVVIGRLETGDCFGEMALIDLQTRSASVRAIQDCRAIKIPRQALVALFRQDLEQYAIIMMNMGREVSRRLRELHERVFAIQQQSQLEALMLATEELTASV